MKAKFIYEALKVLKGPDMSDYPDSETHPLEFYASMLEEFTDQKVFDIEIKDNLLTFKVAYEYDEDFKNARGINRVPTIDRKLIANTLQYTFDGNHLTKEYLERDNYWHPSLYFLNNYEIVKINDVEDFLDVIGMREGRNPWKEFEKLD